jgi:hypothetical protein
MKKYILTIFCGFCIFLAGCQPGARVIFPEGTKNIVIKDVSLSSQILSCMAEKEAMSSKQLHEQFIRENESFQISGSDADRFQLICLCLAWSDSPATLNLGISLLREYISSNDSTDEDMQGLYWLLKSFKQRLQEKEIELQNSETRTNVLENQLQNLKNIEKILNDRNN